MKTKHVMHPGRLEERLAREDRIILSLLRVVTDLASIRKDLTASDFEHLPALAPFLEAADQLVVEMGFSDND
jgi:hypothetical protein